MLHGNQIHIVSSEVRFSEYRFIKSCQCLFLCTATEEHLFSFCLLHKILYSHIIEYIYHFFNSVPKSAGGQRTEVSRHRHHNKVKKKKIKLERHYCFF